MKSKPVSSTNGPAFFKLLKRAAHPLPPQAEKTKAPLGHGDCGDSKTRSNTSGSASEKRDGKSREPLS